MFVIYFDTCFADLGVSVGASSVVSSVVFPVDFFGGLGHGKVSRWYRAHLSYQSLYCGDRITMNGLDHARPEE